MSSIFSCNICLEQKTSVEEIKTLYCKHKLCRNCYIKLKNGVKEERRCPFCREEFKKKTKGDIFFKNVCYVFLLCLFTLSIVMIWFFISS